MDAIIKSTKRGDGLSNVLLSVDGEQHMIMGIDDKADAIAFIKAQNQSQATTELARVGEEIKGWKVQEPMTGITQGDIDARLAELQAKKSALAAKAVG